MKNSLEGFKYRFKQAKRVMNLKIGQWKFSNLKNKREKGSEVRRWSCFPKREMHGGSVSERLSSLPAGNRRVMDCN